MDKLKNESGFTWAATVPLVGGMCFGAERALGGRPEFIASWPDVFGGNDAMALKRYTKEPFIDLSKTNLTEENAVDVVVALCPCSGLSHATTTPFGCDGRKAKNLWMTNTMTEAMHSRAKVIVGENAPNLFTGLGIGVRERMLNLANEKGYYLSFIKTSTLLHGIPQSRERTFYFAWRADLCDGGAPFLAMMGRTEPTKTAAEYLMWRTGQGADAEQNNSSVKMQDSSMYRFLRREYGDRWRTAGDLYDEVPSSSFLGLIANSDNIHNFLEYLQTDEAKTSGDYVYAERLFKRLLVKRAEKKWVLDVTPSLPRDNQTAFRALLWRNIHTTVHPEFDRYLTFEELLALMDVPEDFEDIDRRKSVCYTQNVPTVTAMDAVYQARLFLEGRLDFSKSKVTWLRRKNGWHAEGDHHIESEVSKSKLRVFTAPFFGGESPTEVNSD